LKLTHFFKNAKFEYIMDATIAYENEKEACLWNWWFGTPQKVHIHWTINKVDHDMDEKALQEHLYGLWMEKEQMLKHFEIHGYFPILDKEEINGNVP
jgi:hypothetical protein